MNLLQMISLVCGTSDSRLGSSDWTHRVSQTATIPMTFRREDTLDIPRGLRDTESDTERQRNTSMV